ncbi:MAG TPA: hydantoinase B/oxoprolinase family protein [Thermomicrobiales bacterium]
MSIDPSTFAVVSQGLSSIAQEMGEKLVRSAFSTIIREARDCSTSLLDRDGRVIAQAQFCPIHMNSFTTVFEAFSRRHNLATLRPGEALLTNDPYSGGQHLNDFVLFTPIFSGDDLIAFSASIGHHIDVGGGAAGPNAGATDVYSEGLRLPLLRFDLERDLGAGLLEQVIRANVRPPDLVLGDVYAQIAANKVGETRLLELIDRYGVDTIARVAAAVQDYSERLARRAISSIPDGVYTAEDCVDDNGYTDEPLRVAVAITVAGDAMRIDFAGSSPQTRGIVNSPLTSTVSSAYGAIALLLGGGTIPVNDGLYRPVAIDVPLGSFLNPDRPLPVRARNNPCSRVYNAIMLAMAPVLPDRVLCSGHDTTNAVGMGHLGPDGYRVYMEVVGGGWGACAEADGADVVDCPLANCSNIPVESLETEYPFLQIEVYGLNRGSAGAGRRRGGLGVRRVYRILDDNVTLNCYSDRFRIRPWGLFGGQLGAPTRYLVERDGELIPVPSKASIPLQKGDRLIVETAGGGGYGPPAERDPLAVAEDVANGFLSAEEAREAYGAAVGAG